MAKNKINLSTYFLILSFFTLNAAKAQFNLPAKGSYYNKNKINFLSGGNNYNGASGYNISTIHGIHLSERFDAGLGIGLTDGVKYTSPLIPVFLNGTLSLTDTRDLFLSGDLGYLFATEKVVKGGLMGEISVGLKLRVGKFAIAPEIGYRYDAYQLKGYEMIASDGNFVIRPPGEYFTRHITSFSTGLSVFF